MKIRDTMLPVLRPLGGEEEVHLPLHQCNPPRKETARGHLQTIQFFQLRQTNRSLYISELQIITDVRINIFMIKPVW